MDWGKDRGQWAMETDMDTDRDRNADRDTDPNMDMATLMDNFQKLRH
jgi:hypothetical protein